MEKISEYYKLITKWSLMTKEILALKLVWNIFFICCWGFGISMLFMAIAYVPGVSTGHSPLLMFISYVSFIIIVCILAGKLFSRILLIPFYINNSLKSGQLGEAKNRVNEIISTYKNM